MNALHTSWKQKFLLGILTIIPGFLFAQTIPSELQQQRNVMLIFMILLIILVLIASIYLSLKVSSAMRNKNGSNNMDPARFNKYMENFSKYDIDKVLTQLRKEKAKKLSGSKFNIAILAMLLFNLFSTQPAIAQAVPEPTRETMWSETGVIITIILILVPILVGIVLMIVKVSNMLRQQKNKHFKKEAEALAAYLESLSPEEAEAVLAKRKKALEFSLTNNELSGSLPAEDNKGLLGRINTQANIRFIESKRRGVERPNVDPKLSQLVLWFLITATFWLLFGTSIGEYLGIKFVAPDADHLSWLSFGRLRPVHTNAVFWGWSSLAMLGLGYYVIPRVGNNEIYSLKLGWWALIFINASVLIGSISLMAGINNGGGEYREYIWPIQLLFGIGLVLTLINFLKTIARRKTKEIYVSNWYIVAAVIFGLVISLVAYIPFWQNGLGETIVQGYYMHQGVGMWFMMFTLGLVYYYLPQQLNKPIYSYALGILAFWSQIFFYTLIGSHHFVFSAIPWWLQTVAIVGSMGMVIPVVSGTTNFLMTFKGSWHKLAGSYSLPFFLIGTIFYFTGSLQGTAEAFRTTNLVWHFTDFTVAHSHLTMYGIIAFFVWGGIYAIVPRITRKEPPQLVVGMHFWMALIGLLFYTVPLMYGSTLKGYMWIEKLPFMDSVVFSAPYWLWRAIGGTLMWTSHLLFAFNMYKMIVNRKTININEEALSKIAVQEAELIDMKG